MQMKLWSGCIIGKTDCGETVYFANLTEKQVWWDINPYYSACHMGSEQIKSVIKLSGCRQNLIFDCKTSSYCIPTIVSKMEEIQ